ncbi:MAG: carboxypeptidase-like regulatory domain-containing protein [Acidobacteriaceae bacterium]
MPFGSRKAGRAGWGRSAFLIVTQAALLTGLGFAQQAPPAAPAIAGHTTATILGTVKDVNGNVVPNASITFTGSRQTYTAAVNANGFFSLSVTPGTYAMAVSAPGLVPWKTSVTALAGEYREIPGIVLKMNALVSTVQVNGSENEIATEQVKMEEDQRILGAIPNFYVSYVPNAAPLSAKQKFGLAWKYSIDPFNLLLSGGTAGIEQAENTFPGYGQGAEGYGKRFGAAYADNFVSDMIGGAVLPVLLHQDPRFYYRGTGSVVSRAEYAIATVFICKGDNGKWEPNYSFVVGNFAAGAISNLYYPAQDRGFQTTMDNGLINTAMGAVGALAEEFLLKRLTHGGEARK